MTPARDARGSRRGGRCGRRRRRGRVRRRGTSGCGRDPHGVAQRARRRRRDARIATRELRQRGLLRASCEPARQIECAHLRDVRGAVGRPFAEQIPLSERERRRHQHRVFHPVVGREQPRAVHRDEIMSDVRDARRIDARHRDEAVERAAQRDETGSNALSTRRPGNAAAAGPTSAGSPPSARRRRPPPRAGPAMPEATCSPRSSACWRIAISRPSRPTRSLPKRGARTECFTAPSATSVLRSMPPWRASARTAEGGVRGRAGKPGRGAGAVARARRGRLAVALRASRTDARVRPARLARRGVRDAAPRAARRSRPRPRRRAGARHPARLRPYATPTRRRARFWR